MVDMLVRVVSERSQEHYRMWFDADFPRRNTIWKIDGAGGGDDATGIYAADVESTFWVTNITCVDARAYWLLIRTILTNIGNPLILDIYEKIIIFNWNLSPMNTYALQEKLNA